MMYNMQILSSNHKQMGTIHRRKSNQNQLKKSKWYNAKMWNIPNRKQNPKNQTLKKGEENNGKKRGKTKIK